MRVVAIESRIPPQKYRSEELLPLLGETHGVAINDAFLRGLGIVERAMLVDPQSPQAWWDAHAGTHPFAREGAEVYRQLMRDRPPLGARDKIVVVSNTPDMIGPHIGYAIEARLRALCPDTDPPRITAMVGEGCSGYISALREASEYLAVPTHARSRVVILTVEAMTPLLWSPALTAQVERVGTQSMRRGLVIQKLLFGDGCTASLCVHDDEPEEAHGLSFSRFGRWSNLRPQDIHLLEIIGNCTQGGEHYPPQGYFMQSPRLLFRRLATAYLPAAASFLTGQGVALDSRRIAVHTGSGKILDAVQRGLGLSAAQLVPSRQTLASHGNMNSSTGPFVLKKHLENGAPSEILAVFFGVGFCLQLAF